MMMCFRFYDAAHAMMDDFCSISRYCRCRALTMSQNDVKLSCPICFEKYSDTHPPVAAPQCMHSICQPCAIRRNSGQCVTCNVVSYTSTGYPHPHERKSTNWTKNFALIDCIQEINKLKLEADLADEKLRLVELECAQKLTDLKSEYDNDIDHMSCGQCGVKEKRERMKICCGCAGIKEMDSSGKDMEAKLLSVTICAFCYTERQLGHNVTNYLSFKVHNLLSVTVSDGIEMVNSMDELCAQASEDGAEQIVAWREKMSEFSMQHQTNVTYRDCLSINDSLKKEAEIVCNATEDTLPSLRKLTKIVQESRDRVSVMLTRISTNRGYFTNSHGLVKSDDICLYTPGSDIVVCVGQVPDAEAIARANRMRKEQGLAEYLRLEPAGSTKRIHDVHHCLTKNGFAFKANGKLQARSGGEPVTIWKVVYGGGMRLFDERQEDEEREQTEESDIDEVNNEMKKARWSREQEEWVSFSYN